jgi:hypothetical protein
MTVKRGDLFTHRSSLDANRQPAQMKITRVTATTVYYTYADSQTSKGAWLLDRGIWEDRYGAL